MPMSIKNQVMKGLKISPLMKHMFNVNGIRASPNYTFRILQTRGIKMAISLEYCSVSCNRTPHAVNWEPSGDRLAFATDKSIAIAETIQVG